jgi:hypothetical protein
MASTSIETSKRLVREYRARAAELRARTGATSKVDEVTVMLRDADTRDRMADWEEKNAPLI